MTAVVYWQTELRVWGSLNAQPISSDDAKWSRFWNAFGIQDPAGTRSLNITCEANPAHEGIDRKVAGLFARDDDGSIYLLHTGGIGGGRKGVGRDLFWHHWQEFGGETVEIWDGQRTKPYAVVAQIGTPSTADQVASFVLHIADMKQGSNKPGSTQVTPASSNVPKGLSRDESEKSSVYVRQGVVETKADHGPVVNALRRQLDGYGLRHNRDGKRDAYVLSASGHLLVLFEVKTTSDTQAVYAAIGQLMMNGRAPQSDCRLVLVLPGGEPRKDFIEQLDRLGVELLTYAHAARQVRFNDLESLLHSLPRSAYASP